MTATGEKPITKNWGEMPSDTKLGIRIPRELKIALDREKTETQTTVRDIFLAILSERYPKEYRAALKRGRARKADVGGGQ